MAMTWGWIGGLVLVLVAQAIWAWFKFQVAERSAVHSRKLLEATQQGSQPHPGHARVLPFRGRGVPAPASPSEKAQP